MWIHAGLDDISGSEEEEEEEDDEVEEAGTRGDEHSERSDEEVCGIAALPPLISLHIQPTPFTPHDEEKGRSLPTELRFPEGCEFRLSLSVLSRAVHRRSQTRTRMRTIPPSAAVAAPRRPHSSIRSSWRVRTLLTLPVTKRTAAVRR